MIPPSSRNNIIIHHISDLHFEHGLQKTASGYDVFPKGFNGTQKYFRTDAYLHEHLDHLKPERRPHVIIVSGDLTYFAKREEFQMAGTFLDQLSKRVKTKPGISKPLVVVPGNHDVDWSTIKPGRPLPASRFDAFKTQTARLVTPFTKPPYLFVPPNILIYALDSVALSGVFFEDKKLKAVKALRNRRNGHGGKVHSSELDNLLKLMRVDPSYIDIDELRSVKSNLERLSANHEGLIKIAVLHHNLTGFGTPEVREFDIPINTGLIKEVLAKNGFQIILHGHKHTYNAVEERELSSQKSLFIIGAGTLSSFGDTRGFNEIEIDNRDKSVRITRFEWHPNQFNPYSTIQIPILTKKPSVTQSLSDDKQRFLTGLSQKLARMEGDWTLSQFDLNDVVRFLEARRIGVDSIDEQFLRDMNQQLESPSPYDKLLFTDILGPRAWSNPDFSVHMAQQIRHYVQANVRLKKDKTLKWDLHFTRELKAAVRKCIRNGRDLLDGKVPQSDIVSQFKWVSTRTPTDDPGPPTIEIARILIWKPTELLARPAKVLIKLHKIVQIPLFYINPKDLSREYGEVDNLEYHVFVNGNICKGRAFNGYYYDLRKPSQRRQIIPEEGIPGIGDPVEHFRKLLEHPRLYFAYDFLRSLDKRFRHY